MGLLLDERPVPVKLDAPGAENVVRRIAAHAQIQHLAELPRQQRTQPAGESRVVGVVGKRIEAAKHDEKVLVQQIDDFVPVDVVHAAAARAGPDHDAEGPKRSQLHG